MVEMFQLLETSFNKLSAKPTKEKEKEKEVVVYWKITPPKAFVDREAWKVSFLKGMYATRLLPYIQLIWLKGNWLTYVVKKLMNFVVLAK